MPDHRMPPERLPVVGAGAIPPPRQVPTIASVSLSLDALAGQVRGLREELTGVAKAFPDPDVIRPSGLPGPNSLSPLPPSMPSMPPNGTEPRPSLPVRAAQSTISGGRWLGKWGVLVSGGLALAGQFIALWKPEYAGPIIQALRLLASLGGHDVGPAGGGGADGTGIGGSP